MNDLTPNELADFRRMRAEWKRYGIKKGVIQGSGITISEEIDGQKIGLNAGATGVDLELCDWDLTGVVGSTSDADLPGGTTQWLGDETKGIYNGALYVRIGEVVSSVYPSSNYHLWDTNYQLMHRYDTVHPETGPTTFNSPTTPIYTFASTYGFHSTNDLSTPGWGYSVFGGWRGVGEVRQNATALTGYGMNSGAGRSRWTATTAVRGIPKNNQFVVYGDGRMTVTGTELTGSCVSQIVMDDAVTRCYGGTAIHNGALYYGGIFVEPISPPPPPPPPPVTPPVSPPPPIVPPVSPPPPIVVPPSPPPAVPPITDNQLIGGQYLAAPASPPPPIAIGGQAVEARTDLHFWKVFGRLIRFSPDGNAWDIKVDNSGNVTASSITTTPGEV